MGGGELNGRFLYDSNLPTSIILKNVIYDYRPVKPNLFIILSSPQVLGQSKDTNLSLFLSEMSFEYIFYAYLSRFSQNNTNSQLSGSVLWHTVRKINMS